MITVLSPSRFNAKARVCLHNISGTTLNTRVQGLGIKGLGFRVQGLGFRVQGLGIKGFGFRVQGLGIKGFWV